MEMIKIFNAELILEPLRSSDIFGTYSVFSALTRQQSFRQNKLEIHLPKLYI